MLAELEPHCGSLAVVCSDAGAANIILSYLPGDGLGVRPVMEGPAAQLWSSRFPGAPPLASVEDALAGADLLLTSTGWSDLPHHARREALRRGIRSIAILDHWVNYRQRFIRDDGCVLPDQVWVTDEYALALSRDALPEVPARLMPNLYLDEQVRRIRELSAAAPAGILYVLEPAGSGWGREAAGEFQGLDYFLEHMDALGLAATTPIRLRPHPTDPAGKYDDWLRRHASRDVALDRSRDLAEAIAGVAYVAGLATFALVVALAAGRQVICTLPPWAPSCPLPHDGLIHLKKIA